MGGYKDVYRVLWVVVRMVWLPECSLWLLQCGQCVSCYMVSRVFWVVIDRMLLCGCQGVVVWLLKFMFMHLVVAYKSQQLLIHGTYFVHL